MSGEYFCLPDSMSNEKLIQKKCTDSVFGWLGLQWMKIAHIYCIFSIIFAVFSEYEKTSIRTKQNPIIFVQQKLSDCRTAVQQHLSRFHEDFFTCDIQRRGHLQEISIIQTRVIIIHIHVCGKLGT